MKTCQKCGVEKGNSEFPHLSHRCKTCKGRRGRERLKERAAEGKTTVTKIRSRTPSVYFGKILYQKKKFCGSIVPFDLDSEFLKKLWSDQKGICPLTGWEMDMRFDGPVKPTTASLDRVVPSSGYVRSNVRFISSQANFAKFGWDQPQFEEFIRSCYEQII